MATSVIILCAGTGERWNNYMGIEKHFCILNDKTIIKNTIDTLRPYKPDITIISRIDNQHLFWALGEKVIAIDKYKSLLEYYKIKSTYGLWSRVDKTVLLMGDVWYTSAAMKKILLNRDTGVRFFGRQSKNFYTSCQHGELFAISFYPKDHHTIQSACGILEHYISEKGVKIAGGWGLYDIISQIEHLVFRTKVIKGKVLYSNFHQILDITDDVDSARDYENLKSALALDNHFQNILKKIKTIFYYFLLRIMNVVFEIKIILMRSL